MKTAIQSSGVFGVVIRPVGFLRRFFAGRNSIFAARPAAKIDQLAPFAAEWPVGIAVVGGLLAARRTFHGGGVAPPGQEGWRIS
jgi:hypothetical protein